MNHQPLWLKKYLDQLNGLYVRYFVEPHLDEVGEGFKVMNPGSLEISGPKITVGNHVHVMALKDKPVRLAVFDGLGSIHIGNYCIVNPGVRISSADDIEIGDSCMLAMNAYLSDADWHDLQHRIYAPGNHKPIRLGKNVWIGDSALVCKGVTIGDNSIVGAWSVVTRDVPANVVVAGNPAKIVRHLDPSHVTTREDLFNMPMPYQQFEDDYNQTLLQDNSFFGWLMHRLHPNKKT